jgi:hypothetical protein
MRTAVDARLVEEASRAALRFECDDCAHFDDARTRCAHGYPVAPHRPGPLAGLAFGRSIVFCKEFELGGDRRNEGGVERVEEAP